MTAEAVLRLSRSRRLFAPLAFAVGAFAMLFDGLRLLVSNWRLTLVQVLPATVIWLAMFDLRARVLRGKSFPELRGPILIPLAVGVVALAIASFFLNAVFAFAIARSRPPQIRPAFAAARDHLTAILVSGTIVGSMLAVGGDDRPALAEPMVHGVPRNRRRRDDGLLTSPCPRG